MVYTERVKITIDALGLVKIILDVVIKHYSLVNLILFNISSLFTSKFCDRLVLSLVYNVSYSRPFILKETIRPSPRTA